MLNLLYLQITPITGPANTYTQQNTQTKAASIIQFYILTGMNPTSIIMIKYRHYDNFEIRKKNHLKHLCVLFMYD